MMRALLVERFRLKAHFETREKTIYVMTFAREDKQLGLKLEPLRRPVEILVVESVDRPTPD